MNKEEIYKYLNDKKIWYEITEHEAVYNMHDLSKITTPYPGSDAKNLFLRDDKKKNYYLISVKGDKRVDLKEFRKQNNTRPLSFASENDLMEILKLKPGSVSPLGILNDENLKVKFCLDDEFIQDDCVIGIHPNENIVTIWMKVSDLIKIIKNHGNIVNFINIT